MRVEHPAEFATLYFGDAREILPSLGKVDAVVTDPPYGINEAAGKNASRGKLAVSKDYGNDDWDCEPIDAALMQQVRTAGNYQIIFGGNFYDCPPTSCWLVWDKENGSSDFADCELAWTNLPKAVRRIKFMWNGMLRAHGETRGDHPTQKPVGVMKWCIGHIPPPCANNTRPIYGKWNDRGCCCSNGKAIHRHRAGD